MSTWSPGERIDAVKLSTYAGDPLTREVNTGTFTTTRTILDTITVPVVAGRRYKIVWDGEFQSSVANDLIRGQLHDGPATTDPAIQLRQLTCPVLNQAFPLIMQCWFNATVTGNETFIATAARLTGSGTITGIANTSSPTLFYVENA
jgi:hypothetical protein